MLEELRHFLLILEHRTFTEAARHAHLSQPALTASIQRLEEQFGARLLHRGPGGAYPTAAGEALVPRARAALAALEEGRRAVEEVQGLSAGEVRLGAGATVCTYLLPPVLAEFRRRYPGIRFRLREALIDAVLDGVHAGELDLGIVSTPDGDFWRHDELILVAAPGLAPVDTATTSFVTFTQGATSRELLDRHFPEANVVMELGSIAGVKGNVRAGIGVALVSRSSVERDLAQGLLVEVKDERTPIVRELRLVHRGAERLPPAAAELRRMLLRRDGDGDVG